LPNKVNINKQTSLLSGENPKTGPGGKKKKGEHRLVRFSREGRKIKKRKKKHKRQGAKIGAELKSVPKEQKKRGGSVRGKKIKTVAQDEGN